MPSPDKNEPSKITGSRVLGGNYTRHEQREFTCSAVQYGRQKYGLFCKTRPPVSFVMSKFQKQNLVKVPFHFLSQQKTRSSAAVFDVALAVRPFLKLIDIQLFRERSYKGVKAYATMSKGIAGNAGQRLLN